MGGSIHPALGHRGIDWRKTCLSRQDCSEGSDRVNFYTHCEGQVLIAYNAKF